MSNFCAIIPQVKKEDGELVNSKLFTDLLAASNNNRQEATMAYVKAKKNEYDEYDENGEPTIQAVVENRTLDPVEQYMFQNKIANQGVNFQKAKYGSKTKKLHQIIEELRKQFPNNNVRFSPRSDGGYMIVHDKSANKILGRGRGHEYYQSIQDAEVDFSSSMTPEKYLQRIIDGTNSKLHKHTAQLLLKNLHKLPVKTLGIDTRGSQKNEGWLGQYAYGTGRITLNLSRFEQVSKQEYEETYLHELIHAFTMSTLDNPKTEAEIEFAKTVKQVYDAFKDSKINEVYGLKDHYEFVSELMSNAYFVAELKVTKPSLVKKLLDAIKKLLGLEIDTKNLDLSKSKVINDLILGVSSFISNDVNPKFIQGDPRVLNKIDSSKPYYLNGGMAMQHSNIEALSNGDKRITVRPTNHPDGEYTFGDAKFRITNLYGKKVGISDIKNPAHLKAKFKGEMGFDETNPKFQHITDFFNGIGEMYIYQIQKIDDTIVNLAKRHVPVSLTTNRKSHTGVTGEINEYTSKRIRENGSLPPDENMLLHIHRKVKYDIGKINKKIQDLEKAIKKAEFKYKGDVQKVIDDYVVYNGGVFDKGYENSPLYKALNTPHVASLAALQADIVKLNLDKTSLNGLIVDLNTTVDLSAYDVQYMQAALVHLTEMESRTYDLSTTEGENQLAEDYNYLSIIIKSTATSNLKDMASRISKRLLSSNISSYVTNLSNEYLNTSGLENPTLDIKDLLKSNDDVMWIEKALGGFGNYPRLEAQLVHALVINGKQIAREKTTNTGKTIQHHLNMMVRWAKKNKYTNAIGQGSITKVYALLVEKTNTGRLDLVKPHTAEYYNEVSEQFKKSVSATDGPDKTAAKIWLRDNFYTKPTSGKYVNPKYEFIQQNAELKDFYEFFKETVKEGYEQLPEYINLKNEEKIPSLMKDAFWEYFSLRKGGIMKSIWLASKTILFGQGHVEMYDETGQPKKTFELQEFNNDNIKIRMVGEIDAKRKSLDLGRVLYEFASFSYDYAEMTKVLPKVRMIQNIVATKQYIVTNPNGFNKVLGAGINTNVYNAITMYIDNKVRNDTDKNWLRIPLLGSALHDENGNQIGQTNFYASDIIRAAISYTRTLFLGFNFFSALANVSIGLVNDIIESVGSEYYNTWHLTKAIGIYMGGSYKKGKSMYTRDESMTKVALLEDYLQTLGEIAEHQDKRKIDMGASTIVGGAANWIVNKKFVLQEWGEDFVHNISMIAYLLAKKTNGKSHWELFEVKNNKLEWNQAEAGFDYEDIVRVERGTIRDITDKLHGNYSVDNASVYNGDVKYQAAIMFKKWAPSMVQARLQARRYNFTTGKYDEGRFQTVPKSIYKKFFNLFSSTIGTLDVQTQMLITKKDITKDDIVAAKKTIADVLAFMFFVAMSGVLMPPPPEDERKWYIPDWMEDLSYWDSQYEFDNSNGAMAWFIKSWLSTTNKISSEAMQMYSFTFYKDIVMRNALIGTMDEISQALAAYWNFLVLPEDSEKLYIQKGVNKGELRILKETRDIVPYWRQEDKLQKGAMKTVNDLSK